MRRLGVCGLTGLLLSGLIGGAAQAQSAIACGSEYTVVAGDTVGSIARRAYEPQDFRALYQLNADRIGPDIDTIEVGVRLRMPCDLRAALSGQDQQTETPAPSTPPQPVEIISTAPPSELEPEPVETPTPQAGEVLNEVEIVFNSALDPQFVLNAQIIAPYLREIERVTQQRVTFREPSTVNRDPEEQMSVVTSGRADGAYMFNNHLAASHPLVQLTMNPMTGGTAQQTAVALWRVYQSHLVEAGTFSDVKLLGFVGAPSAQIWQTNASVRPDIKALLGKNGARPADLSGAPAGSASDRQNVKPVTTTPEAVVLPHSTARAFGIASRFRVVSDIDGGMYSPTVSVFISRQKWDEISAADQRAIEAVSGEALALRSKAWDSFDAGSKIENRRAGVRVTEPDLDLLTTLQNCANLGWEEWIRTADKRGVSGFRAIDAFFREIDRVKRELPG